ncbi:MAG: hypothetical protein IJF84_13330 [Thermoguttaceae bacterium]|nr:hypothetical protein [Thermoguttaceae bacterium]
MLVPLEKPNFDVRFENEYQANAKKYLPYWEDFYNVCNQIKPVYNTWYRIVDRQFDFYGNTTYIQGGWDWESFVVMPKAIDFGIKNGSEVIKILRTVAKTGNPAPSSLEQYYKAPRTGFGAVTSSFHISGRVLKKIATAPKSVEDQWMAITHISPSDVRQFKQLSGKFANYCDKALEIVKVIQPGSDNYKLWFGTFEN